MGFSDDELVTANLASRREKGIYDRFRGRVIFPIIDVGAMSPASADVPWGTTVRST
jgi:DNA primase